MLHNSYIPLTTRREGAGVSTPWRHPAPRCRQEDVISTVSQNIHSNPLPLHPTQPAPEPAAQPDAQTLSPSLLSEFSHDELVDAVKRLFERHFEEDLGLFHDVSPQDADSLQLADFVYVDRSGDLHLIQVHRSFDEAFFDLRTGLHALTGAEANAVWLAMPLDEYRSGNELFNERIEKCCRERGVGIVGVYRCGRGVSARVYVEPVHHNGRYLADHPELETAWQKSGQAIVSGKMPGDYLVVSDHI